MENKIRESNLSEIISSKKSYKVMEKVNKYRKKCLRWQLLEQIDFCSFPVKLNVGQHRMKTVFGGLIYVIVLSLCLWLTYMNFFGSGLPKLKSKIIQNYIYKTQDSITSPSIFDLGDQPISFSGVNATNTNNTKVPLDRHTIIGYVEKNGALSKLNLSVNCQVGNICLRKQDNSDIKIYMKSNQTNNYEISQMFFFICEGYNMPTYALPYNTNINFHFIRVLKQYGGINKKAESILLYNPYRSMEFTSLYVSRLTFMIQQYTTNNKFLGHLSNLLPTTYKYYSYSSQLSADQLVDFLKQYRFPKASTCAQTILLNIRPSDKVINSKQKFDDISSILVFFLSVKETLYFLALFFMINRYNQNCTYLSISNQLFYVNDLQKNTKYDFNSGFQVFLACLLYNSIILSAIILIGKKLKLEQKDILNDKCYYAMLMIAKARQLLNQDTFFFNLQQIISIENATYQKIVLQIQPNQSEDDKQTKEYDYFQSSQLKKYAFEEFCRFNCWRTSKSKNHVYNVLISDQNQFPLCLKLQKQFKITCQSVAKRAHIGLLDFDKIEDDFIPVTLNISQDGIHQDSIKQNNHSNLNKQVKFEGVSFQEQEEEGKKNSHTMVIHEAQGDFPLIVINKIS